jgi:hypothetical protein
MMKSLVYLIGIVVVSSCAKQDIIPQEPNPPTPIITNPVPTDNELSLKGQTWVITKVLNTDFSAELRSDTLVFINSDDYKFNGNLSKYKLYLTPTTYKLSLYDTPWGNFSGSLYNYNIVSGRVDGLDFYDIDNTSRKIKLWMKKI